VQVNAGKQFPVFLIPADQLIHPIADRAAADQNGLRFGQLLRILRLAMQLHEPLAVRVAHRLREQDRQGGPPASPVGIRRYLQRIGQVVVDLDHLTI